MRSSLPDYLGLYGGVHRKKDERKQTKKKPQTKGINHKTKHTMNTPTIQQDINAVTAFLAQFDEGEPKKPQKETDFEARVIDRLMHRKFIPYTVAREIVNSYLGTVKWGYLFNNTPEMVAGQVWQRMYNGIEDVDI